MFYLHDSLQNLLNFERALRVNELCLAGMEVRYMYVKSGMNV